MLICRLRDGPRGPFVEFFADATSHQLTMPTSLGRFQSRSIATYSLKGTPIVLVESKAVGVTKKTFADIVKNGTWISYGDCLLRGGYESAVQNVKASRVYYGLKIEDIFADFIFNNIFEIYALLPNCSITNEPYVVYHGTSQESVKSILKNGLEASQGMLGRAIYFGTFWKAWRFSCMTQEYQTRPGALLRVYAFWQRPVIKTPQSDRCLCTDCKGLKAPPVDHESKWSLLGDFVIAPPNEHLKNEEYACLTSSNIIIDSVGHSTNKNKHHEPLDRSFVID